MLCYLPVVNGSKPDRPMSCGGQVCVIDDDEDCSR